MIKLKIMLFILFAFFSFQCCGGNAENIKIGSAAPDFELQDAFGKLFKLSDYKNQKPVVIYFYPKANTPGCTKQACGIRDNFKKFEESEIVVVGISVDSKESIKDFINQHNLNFPLLSDENKDVSKKYNVLNNIGLDSRITFIIDKNGNIAHIIREVDVETHADEVLKIANELK